LHAGRPSGQKTEAILDAARTVFSRRGFEGTTVDAVAAEAGIAKGTVYLYFKSKDEMYTAALVRDVQTQVNAAREQMAAQTRFVDKVRAFLRVRLQYARQHEDFLRIYLAEHGNMFVKAPACKELRRIARENLTHLASLVEAAAAAGEIRKLPPYAVAGAIGDMARGLMERRLLGWKEYQAEDEIELAISLLWNGIVHAEKTR
jgi:AcrR family transcriptional regulator